MPFFSQKRPARVNLANAAGSLPLTPPPAPGATASALLKRYRPLETRASGGFGSVEVCMDARLQRRVAIKRMPLASPGASASAETTLAALTEARTESMLQHPNIVPVIDFSYDAAYAYLVMEYVDGMSLEEFLEQVDGNSLTYDEAACIGDALAQALAFAHENGVLHLDIKPANVLIDRSGHVKLTDFGMAELTSSAGFGGARGGTIGYMPPEQLDGSEVDERADIFSLAAVLYEGLCATAPFRSETPAGSLASIERGVTRPSDLLPDIPELSEEALLTALSPAPADRMMSVADFGDRFLAQLGSVREGRRSLARVIARLTSDEEDASTEPALTGIERARRAWKFDPAAGCLGGLVPHARDIAVGLASGLSTASVAASLLASLGVASGPGNLAAAIGIGVAAGLAPQIGTALAFTGFLMLVLSATPLVPVLPVAIVVAAAMAGWWFACGRLRPASSAVWMVLAATAAACGDPLLFAPCAAALAGYLLPGAAAAATIALGIPFARLLLAAQAAAGSLPLAEALTALASPSLWIGAAGLAALAAGVSRILDGTWDATQNGRGTGAAAVACALPLIVVVLLFCLAYPMEIASLPAPGIAAAAGVGTLSSIIVGICVYLLGYRRYQAEGDRS